GVTGYVRERGAVPPVLQAGRSAAEGEALIAPDMLARLLRGIRHEAAARSTPLTARELSVLIELWGGNDNDAIARTLRMSPNTVRTHVQNILSKLKVHSKLEAVSLAIRRGWIHIPEQPAA